MNRELVSEPLEVDVHAAQRRRILGTTSLTLAVTVAVAVGVRLTIAEAHPAALVLVLLCVAVFALTPWLMRATGSFRLAAGTLLLGLFLLVPGTGSLVGGLDGPVLILAPLLPFVATFLLGARVGASVTGLLLATLVLLGVLPRLGVELPSSPLADSQELAARTLVLGVAVILAGIFAWLYERQRIRAAARLRKSEALYRRLFEQANDPIALTTVDGRFVDANRACVDFFGFTDTAEMLATNPGDLYVDLKQRQSLLERLQIHNSVRSYESTLCTRRGEHRIVLGTTSVVRDEKGVVDVLLSILRDVTDERRSAREREEVLALLSEKNAELERFAYTVSHDFKSPLITVKGFLGYLERSIASGNSEAAQRDIGHIHRAVDQLDALVEGLLEHSRIGRQGLERQELDLADLARKVIELLAGRIASSGTTVEIAPDLPSVHGDPTLVRLVLHNLVDNAVKFSADQPDPRVRIETRLEGEAVICSVTDNGAGIPPEDQQKVFNLFEQLDPEKPGTGVGLANVQRAVEAHGGRLWIESQGDGRGCTVHFTLPNAPS